VQDIFDDKISVVEEIKIYVGYQLKDKRLEGCPMSRSGLHHA
jgi:hypothetical protein